MIDHETWGNVYNPFKVGITLGPAKLVKDKMTKRWITERSFSFRTPILPTPDGVFELMLADRRAIT